MADQVVSDSGAALSQSEIRRSWYIKSIQSERVKVLVGTNQDPFEVPYDLLAQYSRDFKKLRNALNDSGDEIALPDVTKPTFEDFFIWLHAYEPTISHIDGSESEFVDGALNLAVFAQKYKIYHLRNQASDVVRAALGEGKWSITPDMISAVYKVAPAGSALRQLSFLGFVASEGRTDSTLWQTAFHECQGLGWDYFQYKSGKDVNIEGIEAGGACRFHDHSDIRGWAFQNVDDCPYPHGAPRLLPGQSAVHDIVIPGTDNPPQDEEAAPISSAEVAAEPKPSAEIAAVEETPVEPVVDQPAESVSACWESETTETQTVPADTEPPPFEPAEPSVTEETTVQQWVSKTKDAEPVEVEILPVVEEVTHVTVGNAQMRVPEVEDDVPVLVPKVTLIKLPIVEEDSESVQEGPLVVKSSMVEHVEHVETVESPPAMVRTGSESGGPKKKKKNKGKKGNQVPV
ncbi:hypothetical protein L207DRAFT_572457 [Hyaloscypha variabilis F]|uniref:BTB domain-containing protein n=1 Tax=Hyaloscypha variabilis (strain UAMH 11265 / GT02V1 / F) TaxID=1149755 RepID=A0A2J6R156_HYAVF|nr:hypothetical protein L207DRAFT_572457 [Hyaloscypha variabilis F]